MKKLLSMALAVVMLLGMASLPAFAAEEPVKLVWWTYGEAPKDAQKVIEAANAYSAEKLGIVVDLQFKDPEQLALDLSIGEYYDMIFTCEWTNKFDLNAQNELYYDITDLVAEYTPDLYEVIGQFWQAGTVNDRIYGVPTLKDMGGEMFFRINADYYEGEKGMTIEDTMKFADLEKYMEVFKADFPNEYPMSLTSSGISGMTNFMERIVSAYLVIPYTAVGTDMETTVIPVWECEEFVNRLRLMHKWYELGYINADAATTDSVPVSVPTSIRAGQAWMGYRGWSNPATYGFYVKLSRYDGPYMSRATMQGGLTAMNAGASEDKVIASLKYIELLNTDQAFRDILAYGIEGEHFNYLDNGTVLRTEAGAANYMMDTYITGSVANASVVSASAEFTADPEQWDKVYAGYADAIISATQGFAFNGESTADVRTALYAVWTKYSKELLTGTSDPDVILPQMKAEMEAIGLLDVLAEAQRQLDAHLASRK